MAVKAPITSSLNPNAPLFVPATYMATEDFSPEWWNLVQTSPAFRDYWIRERFECVDDEELTAEDLDELDTVEGFIDQQLEFLDEEQNELAHIEAENDLEGPVSNESVELAKDIKDLNVSSVISAEEHQKSVDQTVPHIAQS